MARALADAVRTALGAGTEPLEGRALVDVGLGDDQVYVDEGPTLKRFRPRAQGRAYRIRKRTSHITIVVQTVTSGPARTSGRAPKTAKAGTR